MPTKNLWNAKNHFVKSLNLIIDAANISCRINARSIRNLHVHTSNHNIEGDKSSVYEVNDEMYVGDLRNNQEKETEGSNEYTEPLIYDIASNSSMLRNRNVRWTSNHAEDTIDTRSVSVVGTIMENTETVDKDGCICN